MLDKFLHMVELGGTRAWQGITKMSETAEKHGKPELAPAIYEACMGLGLHENLQTLPRAERQAWFGPIGVSQDRL
jgi:hypothetical protein